MSMYITLHKSHLVDNQQLAWKALAPLVVCPSACAVPRSMMIKQWGSWRKQPGEFLAARRQVVKVTDNPERHSD